MDKRSLASKSWLRQFIYSVLIVLILLRSVLQQHVAKAVCILSRKNWSFGCKVVYFEGLAPVFCERITILAESEVKRPILSFGYKFMSRLNFAKWNLYLLKSSALMSILNYFFLYFAELKKVRNIFCIYENYFSKNTKNKESKLQICIFTEPVICRWLGHLRR